MELVRHPLVLCLPCVLTAVAWAQEPPVGVPPEPAAPFEGKRIATIQFEPKVQPLEADELHSILPLKIDQPLRLAGVRASIERLFATGRYSDIEVQAEAYQQDAVIVRFVTKNSWFIGDVSIGGKPSSPPSAGQLSNASRLDLGAPYTSARLDQALIGQHRLLEANGLYRARITPQFDQDNNYQQINIRFDVESGPRARFGPPKLAGELKLDPKDILSATRFQRWLIHAWKPVTQQRVRQALDGVRALYRKENRLEATVALESMQYDPATNTAIPTLRIDAGPHIEVRTIGANVSQKKLRRYVPIYEEHAVDRDLLEEGARNLTDYFQGQGYFAAEVVFKQQRVTNDRASIDYLVNTGNRHRLVAIQVAGNRYFSTEAIRERMFLHTAAFLQFPHGRYSTGLLARDEDTIVNLYHSNGFRDARVTHRVEDDFQGKSGDIAVFLSIEEGPQYFVNSLEIAGVEKLKREDISGMLSSVPGQPFSEFSVAVDRDAILAQYFGRGFTNVTFEWSSRPAAADPHRFDVKFTINEGREQVVRQVVATGLRITSPSLVNRRLTLNPGDPLSPIEITEIQRRLYDLGVFARVDAAIQNPDGETDSKYVIYNVDEARRYSMAVGLGAELGRIGGCQACFDAPAGATGFAPRVSLNLARNNLWGRAHTLSLQGRASTLNQRALLNYSWPRFRESDNFNLSFTLLHESSRDIRTFDYRRQEGSAQVSQRYSKSLTFFYRYTYRRVGVSNLKVTPFLIPQLSRPVRVGITSFNLVQDRRDDPVEPHKGIYNTVDLGLADRFFGSQRNFVRFLVRNATYHQLSHRLVLARSTQLGDMRAFHYSGDPQSAIPLPERFFGGGGTSHRGFPELQAGARDTSTGFPLGGTAELFNQTELRFPLVGENIGGVLFHDMGNVYTSLGNLSFRVKQRNLQDFDYMSHAAGFGVRYRTPVGPVRVDLAYSINPPYFYGFKGTPQDLLNAGVNPCSPPPGVPNRCTVQNVSHFQFFFSIGQTF